MKIFNSVTGAYNAIALGDLVYSQGRVFVCINTLNCAKFEPNTNETVWKLTNLKGIEDNSNPAPALAIAPETLTECLADNLNPAGF